MVPLTDGPLARSFAAQLDELRVAITASWQSMTPEAGFVEWAVARCEPNSDLLATEELTLDALPEQRWNEAPVLAALGFRMAVGVCSGPDSGADRWLDGVRRLMSRDAVPADRNSFFFRPLELLGLAIGARILKEADSGPLEWMRQTVDGHVDRLPGATPWSQSLVTLATNHIGATVYSIEPVIPKTQLEVALLLWLHLIDDGLGRAMTTLDMPTLGRQLLEMTAISGPDLRGVAECGVFFLAMRAAVLDAVGGIELHPSNAAQSVVGLCRRFPLLVTELGNRYNKRAAFEVDDEYDVQDVLRAVLRLHFTDVRREEWNPSYGGVQSRSDLLLKPERVVIETKMTRSSLGQRDLVEQLIVDKAQYRSHPDCGTLVCFVYDPAGRLPNPAAIEGDLSDDDGRLRTLVVVSPQGL